MRVASSFFLDRLVP